jgi:hypothetical protein
VRMLFFKVTEGKIGVWSISWCEVVVS